MEKRIVSFETTFESKEADPIPVVEETPRRVESHDAARTENGLSGPSSRFLSDWACRLFPCYSSSLPWLDPRMSALSQAYSW